MRIGTTQGGVAAGVQDGRGSRGGGFAGSLERAVRGVRPERQRDPLPREDPQAFRSVDALLAEIVSPGRSESMSRAAGAPLLARAIDRIVLLVRSGEAASVTLRMGPSLQVRIDQVRSGVEVQIQAVRGLSPMAEAELPDLVAALRARGVRVARAAVSVRRKEGRRSLTPCRSSATTAGNDGSVAKW
jgi:hypothetical protein